MKVSFINFVENLRSDQAGGCRKADKTVVVQGYLSAFVKAPLGAACEFTLSARLRSRATTLPTSHDKE